MLVFVRTTRRSSGSLVLTFLALSGLLFGAGVSGAQERPPARNEAQVLDAYERELRQAFQQRQKIVAGLKALILQDQTLRNRIVMTARAAEQQMVASDRMAELRVQESRASKSSKSSSRDHNEKRSVIVDQSGAKAALAANAMQLASMLPMLNQALGQTNAEFTRLVEAGEKNQRLYRGLADPFGRRSTLEAARAREVASDALLADPEDDDARLVLGFALLRLGQAVEAERQLTQLADRFGPCQTLALGGRGHLRSVGWAGSAPNLRKQGGQDLKRVLDYKPRPAEALIFRALVHWQEGKWDFAENDLQAANKLKPDDVDGLRLLAMFYAVSPGSEKKLVDAQAIAERACTLTNRQDPTSLEALAAVLARRGNWDLAEATQQEAVAQAIGERAARAEQRLADICAKKPLPKTPPLELPNAKALPVERDKKLGKKQLQEEAQDLQPLLDAPGPDIVPNWRARAQVMIRHRKWSPAAVNLAHLLNPQSVNEDWFQYGCLLWLAGDKAAFETHVQRTVKTQAEIGFQLANLTPEFDRFRAPAPPPENRPPQNRPPENRPPQNRPPQNIGAGRAVTPAGWHGLCMAQYRAGEYEAARKLIGEPQMVVPPDEKNRAVFGVDALRWQMIALTFAKEGKREQAEETAKRARALVPSPLPRDFPASDQLTLWLAYQVQEVELTALLARGADAK
ncbi:MAG: tetratricopeptide repeat protein [Planctomycetota bacterium]